ncbi:hypothetical protein [Cryobacterium luteum]|uniref:Antitoxin VbhA domain-containing protein n=1 Tax=Cryobacterium luteum TaxID=1424661 RepID=A0A1H8L0L9_9MICO|nr:hypothetical protein [Cryobacterium luteum]TFB82341.1 hypothetical protein E3O10_17715 [Cryobacterium luteum]SEN98687.1 hypothetical protein SAMN05216281_1239 [Cryobacterium luteum]
MSTDKKPALPTEDVVDARIARIDGAMGAAGHIITDPTIREILRDQAANRITGDEARVLMAAHRNAQRNDR